MANRSAAGGARRQPLHRRPLDHLRGRADLAFCPAEARDAVLNLIRRGGGFGDAGTRRPRWVGTVLERTRADGYGSMDRERPVEPGVSAIAVPIHHGHRVAGCLNLIDRGQAMTVSEAAGNSLPKLNGAASLIAGKIADMH